MQHRPQSACGLTVKECESILEMRDMLDGKWGRLADCEEFASDWALLRFLRGHHGDVNVACKHVEHLFQFMEKYDGYEIRKMIMTKSYEPFESYYDLTRLPFGDIVSKTYPERCFYGHDLDGNPVCITTIDLIRDPYELMNSLPAVDYLTYRIARVLSMQLLLHNLCVKHQRMIRISLIWDLHGFSLAHYRRLGNEDVKKYWGDLMQDTALCFPEVINRVVVFRVPWYLNAVWKTVRVTLPKRLVSKVYIAANTSNISDQFERDTRIPRDVVPTYLGGTCQTEIGTYQPEPLSKFYQLCHHILSIIG